MTATVKLRKRKQTKNGRISLYLEIYKGRITTADGKIKYLREYNFLKLFLIDKPKCDADKEHNKKTERLAKDIRNKKEYELNTGRLLGVPQTSDYKDSNFCDYFYDNLKRKHGAKSNFKDLEGIYNTFTDFAGADITFAEITEKFCERYLEYLQNKTNKSGSQLANVTINHYFHYFSTTIKQALSDKIITENPLLKIKPLKTKKVKKNFLELDDLKKLVNTDCSNLELKRAFIFSCLTGLRWSDIYKLTWSEIVERQGFYTIIYRQQKTDELNYLPLSEQAFHCLGERGSGRDKVFKLSSYSCEITKCLQRWCKDACVNKTITFHSGRHTFGVLQLNDCDTNIVTVQKLMGHKNISSTLRYTSVVDKKKQTAMESMPNVF